MTYQLSGILTNLRSSAILTTSYVASSSFVTGSANQVVAYVNFFRGSLTSGEVAVDFSDDDATWHQETSQAVSGGTATNYLMEHTFAGSGAFRLPIPLTDRFIRIRAKGTGTTTGSWMKIDVVDSNT